MSLRSILELREYVVSTHVKNSNVRYSWVVSLVWDFLETRLMTDPVLNNNDIKSPLPILSHSHLKLRYNLNRPH